MVHVSYERSRGNGASVKFSTYGTRTTASVILERVADAVLFGDQFQDEEVLERGGSATSK